MDFSPNCTVSSSLEATHYVASITYGGDAHIIFTHVSISFWLQQEPYALQPLLGQIRTD